MIDLTALRELAKAATPGEWVTTNVEAHGVVDSFQVAAHEDGPLICTLETDGEPIRANQAFIAAANPAAILELLARLERAESQCLTDAERRCIESWKRDELIWIEQEKALKARLERAEEALRFALTRIKHRCEGLGGPGADEQSCTGCKIEAQARAYFASESSVEDGKGPAK